MTDRPPPSAFLAPLPHPGEGPLVQLLARLSPRARAILTANLHERVVPAGAVLFDEGDTVDSLGQVAGGTLGLIRRGTGGRAHMIGFLLPPDLCGHPFASRATCRLEALTDARLLCVPRSDVALAMHTEPEAEELLTAQVLHNLNRTREALQLIGNRRVTRRVAGFLILLARRTGTGPEGGPLELPMSRAHLALYLGTRPETLSRSLHELADLGVLRIEDPYRFCILSAAALARAAGQDPGPAG